MNILLDTGPIVAFLNKNDVHHNFVIEKMRNLTPPFTTCEAVLKESFFLMSRIPTGTARLIELLEAGKIELSDSYRTDSSKVHNLITGYANVPMSFADACLVQMASVEKDSAVFTLDRDFLIYRNQKGGMLSLICPFL